MHLLTVLLYVLLTRLCFFSTYFIFNAYAGVKVSQNAIPGPGNLSLERSGCKIVDFTAGNYVPGPRKLATFAIVIQYLVSHSNFTFL